jgi:hypothetical protein
LVGRVSPSTFAARHSAASARRRLRAAIGYGRVWALPNGAHGVTSHTLRFLGNFDLQCWTRIGGHELPNECSVLTCEFTRRPAVCSGWRRDAAATRSRDGRATRFIGSDARLLAFPSQLASSAQITHTASFTWSANTTRGADHLGSVCLLRDMRWSTTRQILLHAPRMFISFST